MKYCIRWDLNTDDGSFLNLYRTGGPIGLGEYSTNKSKAKYYKHKKALRKLEALLQDIMRGGSWQDADFVYLEAEE